MPEPVTMGLLAAKGLGGAKAGAMLGKASGAMGLFNMFGGGGNRRNVGRAVNELQPMNVSSAFGSLSGGNYTDNRTQAQQGILDRTEGQLKDSLGYSAPTRSPLDNWNNRAMPVADAMYRSSSRQINDAYDDGQRGMQNQTNARGLMGGSFDALLRSRAMRDRNRQLGAAYDQSQLAGSDYSDNWLRMQMQQQQNLAGLRSQTQQDLLQPWQLANQTRQVNQQLQMARANALMPNNQGMENAFNATNSASNLMNAARKWYPQ